MSLSTDWPDATGVVLQALELGYAVRCFFEGKPDAPDPTTIRFARVPALDETVVHADAYWRVGNVTWTSDGPFIVLSYIVK